MSDNEDEDPFINALAKIIAKPEDIFCGPVIWTFAPGAHMSGRMAKALVAIACQQFCSAAHCGLDANDALGALSSIVDTVVGNLIIAEQREMALKDIHKAAKQGLKTIRTEEIKAMH